MKRSDDDKDGAQGGGERESRYWKVAVSPWQGVPLGRQRCAPGAICQALKGGVQVFEDCHQLHIALQQLEPPRRARTLLPCNFFGPPSWGAGLMVTD